MYKLRISIFFITVILLSIGIVMVYSASAIFAWEKLGEEMFFLRRHLFYILIGIFLASVVMSFDYQKLRKYAKPLVLFSVFLLLLVLFPSLGKQVSGARRWLKIFGISFQPSEFSMLCMIIYLADFLVRKKNCIRSFYQGFLPPLIILGIISSLVLLEPDLGTALFLILVGIIMLFIGGIRISYIFTLGIMGLPLIYFLVFNVPYRRMRILSFLNPWLDPHGAGFQLIQSQLALGEGGILGVGLGAGKQKLFYLPAAHTDFIFSIIGEELGLIGTLLVIGLFGMFFWKGISLIKNIRDEFGFYLSVGIIFSIVFKAIVHIAVTSGLFPTKGLPLPFISYGGSSLITDMISVGILLNIARAEEL